MCSARKTQLLLLRAIVLSLLFTLFSRNLTPSGECVPTLLVLLVLQSLSLIITSIYLDVSQFSEEEKRKVEDKVIGEVDKWMERFDCLVIGPGLGRDPFLLVQDSSHHILLNFEFFLLFDLT